ncbi:MAG: dTDP-4-dehydrorhamnose 3,5-epimerase family protein [Candidatus Magasanikbacteria bacterium]|nr:dTDP-4-dehydrorhamnose 3,5-epimerase family protein [Candidatus Magasanikbacteria bacterium]
MNDNIIDGVVVKKLQKFTDERGWLTEIYRDDEIDYKPVMSYVSVTKPGVARGPHEHRDQSDCFVFIGPGDFRLYLWDNRKDSDTHEMEMRIRVGENNPTMVIIPPGVVHGYKCISKGDAYCINLPDRLYKGEEKKDEVDEIRWEQDENSPFKIA